MSFLQISNCPFCNDKMELPHNINKPHSTIFYLNLLMNLEEKSSIIIIIFCKTINDINSIVNDPILNYFIQNKNCKKHQVKYVYHCISDDVAFSVHYSAFIQLFESNIKHFYFNSYIQKQYNN